MERGQSTFDGRGSVSVGRLVIMIEWRQFEDWPYEVSNDGRVRRIGRRELKPFRANSSGHLAVDLADRTRSKKMWVHKMVATVFLGPANGRQTRHLNGDPTDNRVENLRWGTQAENEADKLLHGRAMLGTRNHLTKFSDADVFAIRSVPRERVGKLADSLGMSRNHAWAIRAGRMRRHLLLEEMGR
jgi:hypothetical protein